jgi:hypothetical protein
MESEDPDDKLGLLLEPFNLGRHRADRSRRHTTSGAPILINCSIIENSRRTHSRLSVRQPPRSAIFSPISATRHRGDMVKRTGDGILIEFRSVVDVSHKPNLSLYKRPSLPRPANHFSFVRQLLSTAL